MTVKGGLKAVEINLTCPAEVNRVLVATRTRLGCLAFIGIKIDSDAIVVTRKLLARPITYQSMSMDRSECTYQASL